MSLSVILVATIATCLTLVLIVAGIRAAKLARDLDILERTNESLQAESRALTTRVTALQEEDKKKIGWLDHQENELAWMRAELEKRPKITRKTYRILTVGVKATGKTSLTLKWANPLIDLGTLEGTKIERYERTVSHVPQKDSVVEHVFEVHDWGGEHIVNALQELILEEIHGLLVVVDLGSKNAQQLEVARVEEQIREFQPPSLRYFFAPKTVASCKTVVLFINKSDLLSGTPAEVEEQAKNLYAPLIDSLMQYSTQIDVRVFVGSANYGHSTHLLFSHFVQRILPKHAYDTQLLQRMQSDFAATRVPSLVGCAPPGEMPAGLIQEHTARLPGKPSAGPAESPMGQTVPLGRVAKPSAMPAQPPPAIPAGPPYAMPAAGSPGPVAPVTFGVPILSRGR